MYTIVMMINRRSRVGAAHPGGQDRRFKLGPSQTSPGPDNSLTIHIGALVMEHDIRVTYIKYTSVAHKLNIKTRANVHVCVES